MPTPCVRPRGHKSGAHPTNFEHVLRRLVKRLRRHPGDKDVEAARHARPVHPAEPSQPVEPIQPM